MVEIFGKNYYIDLDSVTEKCRTGNKIKEEDGTETTEINIFKFEIIKLCLDRVMNDIQEIDDGLGAFAQKDTTISFRIAFNTLIKNEIIIEDDE
jgi:hypothetical protein